MFLTSLIRSEYSANKINSVFTNEKCNNDHTFAAIQISPPDLNPNALVTLKAECCPLCLVDMGIWAEIIMDGQLILVYILTTN